jgi:hypothetical protein
MASTDARLIPYKSAAWRVTFTILDADGDPVSGATGLDSEISKDGGTFVDCTNEATEIATASGVYFLDLTSTEMNADTVALQIKTTSAGAKATIIVAYPQEADDVRVAVTHWGATAIATPDTAGCPKVTLKSGTGAGEVSLSSGLVSLPATGLDAVLCAEPSGVPALTANLKTALSWLLALARNKILQTSSTSTLRNDADSGAIATSTVSDDGTTFTRGEWS